MGDPLARLNKHVDFRLMAEEIDRWVPRPSRAKGGRPAYPTALMTRLLVLQQLCNLSDEQMAFQLLDRMSFQHFAGLQDSARVPDRNTIWNCRERLVPAKVEQLIFDEVQRHLQLNGFNAREGPIIDASIVRAPTQHNTAEEQEIVKQRPQSGNRPRVGKRMSRRAGRRSTATGISATSCRSAWIAGTNRSATCGRASDASEADTLHLVMCRIGVTAAGTSGLTGVIATSHANAGSNSMDGARTFGAKGKPISARDKARHTRIASPRARVEHIVASLAQMGGKTIRSIGLARAQFGLTIKSALYNLKRMSSLLEMA